jgi:hypothetical protein
MASLRKEPLAWILCAAAIVRVIAIGWGLPASDGWDNDGVAPRDFLVGLVETFTPGHYFTYPPFHLLVLGLLTSPVSGIALWHAPSLAPHDVIGEMVKVPYMTAIAYIARFTSLAMSLGITWGIAKITEELKGKRAGLCAAAISAVDMSLTYYGHTSNLDVPYFFWATLALLALTRAIVRHQPARLRTFAILAVLAIATKDQAYALFILGAPLTFAAWFWLDDWARANARSILRETARATAYGAVLLLVVDAIVINPTGFRARLAFLTGPASRDFEQYSRDLLGTTRLLYDAARLYASFWPWLVMGIMALGLYRVLREKKPAGLIPLFAAVSFTIAFNCVARRAELRFILPQSALSAVYGGVGLEVLLFGLGHWLGRAVAAVALLRGAFMAFTVDANMLFDPRYDVERFMAEHVQRGDTIETYGHNVYLPRFPDGAKVVRVGDTPPTSRNPMPGIEEITGAYENVESRGPRWIVLSYGWAWRYLIPPSKDDPGIITPKTQTGTRGDPSGTAFFRDLLAGRRGYRVARTCEANPFVFPRLNVHASLGQTVWILERDH